MKRFIFLSLLLAGTLVQAQEIYRAPELTILGEKGELEHVPGTAIVVDEEELEVKEPVSAQEALRNKPGVNIRGEDAVGLIPNIGIRGLNPDRSERILFLEDGLPAGLAPYTENAAYYVPPIERMESLELLKGSGSILWGPQTVGGVLNFITPKVPRHYYGLLRLEGGSHNYNLIHGRFGKTWKPFGFEVFGIHKQGNGFTREEEDFRLDNFSAKMAFNISDKTKLWVKNTYHDQSSNQSYLGITPAIFETNPRFNPVPNDQLDLWRYDLQMGLQHFFADNVELVTNLYFWKARRNWLRQDFARNINFEPAPANTLSTVGDSTIDGGAIYLRESYGSRDRSFSAVGIEPRLIWDYGAFGKRHQLHAGVRFHYENMLNERNNRASLDADPVTRDRDRRKATAFAFFFQNELNVTDRLTLVPGFRLEYYKQTRDLTRQANTDVDFGNSSTHLVPIPGLGLTYQIANRSTFFTGVHRGFAPPRTSQAIDSAGEDLDLEAELSWNFEAGVRTQAWKPWYAEATFFYLNFSNQVVPANESGGASTTDTNAGQTRHVGLEFLTSLDLLGLAKVEGHHFFLEGNYTFVDAKNTTAGGAFEGNTLPYAPKNLARIGLHYVGKRGPTKGLDLITEAAYTGSQFADQANTVVRTADGTIGEIPSYWLFNFYASYQLPKTGFNVHLKALNLLNNTYIASRAPQGIFPGAGVTVLGGIGYEWGGKREN